MSAALALGGVGLGLLLLSAERGRPGAAAPASGSKCAPLKPSPKAGAAAEQVPLVAARIRRFWPLVTGEKDIPPAALEIMLCQSWLESGLGTWWTDRGPGSAWAESAKGQAFAEAFPGQSQGDMRGSCNLAARQCGNHDAGASYYRCVPYGDSIADAKGVQHPIQASFRYYQAGTLHGEPVTAEEAAAYDLVNDLVHVWPALAELKSGDVLAYVMRQGPKYRADDPPHQKVFGRDYEGGNFYYGGFGATMQARVGGYGLAIVEYLPAVAAALGHDRVYACVAPELLAGTPYAPTAGYPEQTMRSHLTNPLGCPAITAGYVEPQTQAGVKVYMRRLDDGYEELNGAVMDVARNRPPASATAWQFINGWILTYGAWKTFYAETIGDWIITTDDQDAANDFGARLDKARAQYPKALGEKPPGDPIVKPATPEEPKEPVVSAIEGVASLAKWLAIGYVALQVVHAVGDKK